MKSISLASLLALTASAGAQPAPPGAPGPTPPPAPAPAPAPAPGDQPTEDQPSWLPGVQDVTAAELETPGKLTITMARAVELALKEQPNVRLARAQAEAAVGHVEQARLPLHPTIAVSAGANAGSTNATRCVAGDPTMLCGGGFFSETYGINLGATAKWTIYDFGQTHANVNAAQASADASQASIGTTNLDVRQTVELAYLESVARQRLILVAQATVKSEDGHLDQAKRFVAAQAHDPIEVAQAQSRLANAKSALAQAQSNEAVALANLRAAIGWIDPTRSPAVDPNWPVPADTMPPDLPALVSTARKHRPEIVALDKQVLASDYSLTAAHAERRPSLSAVGSVGWLPGEGNWSPDPTWTVGVTLSWLLYDGGKSSADVHVAHANLESSVAERDQLLVTMTSALEAARALIVANKANVQASTEAVTAAQAQLKLANARYAQGLGSQIELADAQTAVTTAEGNLVTAEWQLADAWAELKRATGEG